MGLHPTGSALLVPTTVGHPLSVSLDLFCSLASSVASSWPLPLACGFTSTCLLLLLPLPGSPLFLLVASPDFRGTCMSTDSIESLSLKIDFLSSRVEALEKEVAELKEAAKSSVVSGYTLVEAPSSAASAAGDQHSVAPNDYNTLATTIPSVPEDVVRACALLSGGRLSFRQRAERAWAAEHWARFVLEGKLGKPRPTTPIDLAKNYYVVLRAPGFPHILLCDKASDYSYVIGDFKNDSVSHGFPSKAEAWTYARAAGFALPATPYRWSSSN